MIYNVEMKTERKRGRPSGYPPELGLGVKKNPRYPLPIHQLLQEQAVKNLLSRMAMDDDFKNKILIQVEE
jgi:hypothetical protein